MKIILLFLGILSLVLGVAGIFLPVLPTTPFLLLSATLFLRSSKKLYDWLLTHPYLGEYIRNFKEYKAIPLRVKIVSVSLVWITLLYCALFVARIWWMSVMFIAIALGVSIHILSYKTLRK
ncbi:MAG: YbaN family protein [Bacteroidaceae bacterium]|nr:YbaN family protein [Bacteroidaceae bacterium]